MPARYAIFLTLLLATPSSAFASGNAAASAATVTSPAVPAASPSIASPARRAFGDARDTPEWAALTALVGEWVIATPATDAQRAFRTQYRLVSNAAALVEIYGDLDGRFTQTIFHPDGDRILATHYCAQGNQPRLRLSPGADTLRFEFHDVTNLANPSASHLTRLELKGAGDNLMRRETYASGAGEEVDTLQLVRID